MNSIEEGGELRNPEKKYMKVNKEAAHHQYHEENPNKNSSRKPGCNFYGLKNHSTKECKRKELCELCGFANHSTSDCKRESLFGIWI